MTFIVYPRPKRNTHRMKWPFTRRIASVKMIARGAGHVRLITLRCGHKIESMKSIPVAKKVFVCEDCRKAAR